ncbi:response regulator [Candidatus Finniella inopinata]|uniref:Response regulator transcription factor n=1 Tax=Candidatus Finniella inopinata TaxID=1696036 RepID=A0A4V2DZV4_9PROT|nr:response regulator transcription factor [Candidatus Finniella inopinata]RZI46367.1 response regulator transcription factor [Candidatus Finniella inopinata]
MFESTKNLPNLLVVDDDQRLRSLLVQFLTSNDLRVQAASNAAEARSYMASQSFDVLIIDIMMPGESGLELTQSLRKNDETPILLLTARDQLHDKLSGFDSGADDYLTKPFEPAELLARIKVLLRRKQEKPIIPFVFFGEYRFSIQTGQLRHNSEIIHLTSTELILLKTLAQSPRQPFSREELAQRMGHRVSERTVDVQITRLRKKIGDDPRQPRTLQTIRHIGYALCPD